MMTGFGWDMGLGGWLWMVVGIVLVVVIVWALVAAVPTKDRPAAEDAARILKARFARGEISAPEYEQARRLLGI
ncbi:MAG: SHOCT domain-containing protein [Candidatus Limnocylindrales bacterium]|nr:SHOCT domain-containing protein [Chloroflexota bacterium]